MVRRAFFVLVAFALFGFAGTAQAAGLKVKPGIYDPDGTGCPVATWQSGVGLPDASAANHGLVIAKNCTTGTNAAAGAVISGAPSALTDLGFDISNDSYCGAGAPRFNVYTSTGVIYFYGCTYGTHTAAPDDPANWTRVRFAAADGFPSDGTSTITDWSGVTVTGIEIIMDEGPASALLDNIDLNGTLIGKPGNV
jgi:hypothetical protein